MKRVLTLLLLPLLLAPCAVCQTGKILEIAPRLLEILLIPLLLILVRDHVLWIIAKLRQKIKSGLLMITLLLMTGIAMGQHPFMQQHSETQSSTLSFVNHIASCGGTQSCWHQSSASAAIFTKIRASNGQVFAIDGANNGYEYSDYPTNQWVKHSEWGAVYDLQADSQGNIWMLYNNGNCPSNGGYSLGEWNGSGIDLKTYCFEQFALTQDQTNHIYLVDVNGTFWSNVSGTWAHAVQNSTAYPVNSIAAQSDSQLYVTQTNGNILSCNASSCSQLPGSSAILSNTQPNISVNDLGDLYVIGSNQIAYHYNGTPSGWDQITINGLTSIAASEYDMGEIFATGPTVSGNDVYRFSHMTMRYAITFSQTAACLGCQHDNWTNATWKANYSGNGRQELMWNPPPNNPGTRMVSSYADIADPLLCLEEDPTCIPQRGDYSHCTVAAVLVNDLENGGGNPPLLISGKTRTQKASGGGGVQLVGSNYVYTVSPYCSNTANPMWNPHCIVTKHSADLAIDTHGWCFSAYPSICLYRDITGLGGCIGATTTQVDHEYGVGLPPPFDADPGPAPDCTPVP